MRTFRWWRYKIGLMLTDLWRLVLPNPCTVYWCLKRASTSHGQTGEPTCAAHQALEI